MIILALESGAEFWGWSLARIGAEVHPLAVTIETTPRALARELFSSLQSTLDAAQIALDEVDALAVATGPGSWTGLRIGLTAMKTLAQTRDLPIAAVPSFDPVAQAVWRGCAEEAPEGDTATRLLLTAAPCRAGELYGKLYECAAESLSVVQQEWIGSPQLLADTLRTEALARGIEAAPLLAGFAAEKVAERLHELGEEYLVASCSPQQQLLELAIAGALALASDGAADPMSLAPLYLAPSNAERNLLFRS